MLLSFTLSFVMVLNFLASNVRRFVIFFFECIFPLIVQLYVIFRGTELFVNGFQKCLFQVH
nr:hypothetical protein pPsy0462c_00050 [Pseudomonas syringae]